MFLDLAVCKHGCPIVSLIIQFLLAVEISEDAGSDCFMELIESHCGKWLQRKLKLYTLYLEYTPVVTHGHLQMSIDIWSQLEDDIPEHCLDLF